MKTFGPATPGQADDAIAQRAADFFQRRRFWDWSEKDQAELDAWLAESILHEVAYLRVEGIVAHAEDLIAVRPGGAGRISPGRAAAFNYRRLVLPLLAAASIALIAAIGFPFVTSLLQPPDRTYATDVGGHALIKFADRTQVELNTDTVVRSRMTTAERTVWLDRGEAWFRVAHDAAHPFSVVVGRHRITDLGTEFLVRRGADGVEVALLNGRAAFDTDGAAAVMLAPGEDAVATPTKMSLTKKTPQELADELAWRRGVLVFRNTKLGDAVREFNRYNTTKMVIADPSIADLKFTLEIRNDNLGGFLHVAESLLQLHADWRGDSILLSREPSEKTKKVLKAKGR
jgi:transmembrane sensor